MHAAQIDVIDLHQFGQPMSLIALPQGLHELVLEQPAGVVVDAELAPPFQAQIPFLVWDSSWMARSQVVRGSLVDWKSVPASGESWRLQRLHWNVERRVARRRNLLEPQLGQPRPWGQRVEEGLLAPRLAAVDLEALSEAETHSELDSVLGRGS